MRLSEAIRLGSMLHPQHFGSLWGPAKRSSCALGAAIEATGAEAGMTASLNIMSAFPYVERLENENGWGIDPTIEENQCESELSENQASPAIATG